MEFLERKFHDAYVTQNGHIVLPKAQISESRFEYWNNDQQGNKNVKKYIEIH